MQYGKESGRSGRSEGLCKPEILAFIREQNMQKYKEEFIDFMVECGVLQFGDFMTKSGRKTPFYVNTGFYRTGSQLLRLGSFYAQAVKEAFGLDFDVLFGPAYKGIPLAVAASMAVSSLYGKDVKYCSNRKEIKDHGDQGILLGTPLQDQDRVVIIEDVTTAGTSIRETVPLLKAQAKVQLCGLVVSVDRMEHGTDPGKGALEQVGEEFGLPTASIVTMAEVVEYLSHKEWNGTLLIDEEKKKKIDAYYQEYGVLRG